MFCFHFLIYRANSKEKLVETEKQFSINFPTTFISELYNLYQE